MLVFSNVVPQFFCARVGSWEFLSFDLFAARLIISILILDQFIDNFQICHLKNCSSAKQNKQERQF